MNLDIEALLKEMLSAASASAKHDLREDGAAAQEFRSIAELMQEIGEKFAAGQIDQDDAEADIDGAKEDIEAAIETEAGLAELAAQDAVNAALDVVATVVNKFVGFGLL